MSFTQNLHVENVLIKPQFIQAHSSGRWRNFQVWQTFTSAFTFLYNITSNEYIK